MAILVTIFVLWLVFPGYSMVKFSRKLINRRGVPYYNLYNLPRFRDSDMTLNFGEYLPKSGALIYSNYSAAVYLYYRLETHGSPSKRDFFGDGIELLEYQQVWPRSSPALLVWYEPNSRSHLFPLDGLATLAELNPLYQSEDGAIYLVETQP